MPIKSGRTNFTHRRGHNRVEWIEGDSPPTFDDYQELDVIREHFPKRIMSDLTREYDEPQLFIYKVPTGVGKTTATLSVIQELATREQRAAVYMPTRAHFHDMMNNSVAKPDMWHQWMALTTPIPDTKKTACKEHFDAGRLTEKGWVLDLACASMCRFHKPNCDYQQQKSNDKAIIAYTHIMLTLPNPMSKANFEWGIIDEDCAGAFGETRKIPWSKLPFSGDANMVHLMRELARIGGETKPKYIVSGRRLMKRVHHLVEPFLEYADNHMQEYPTIDDKKDIEDAPFNVVQNLAGILRREFEAYNESDDEYADRIRIDCANLYILSKKAPSKHLPDKLIVLDGTADVALYRALFPNRRITTYEPKMRHAGQLNQIVGKLYGTGTLKHIKDKDKGYYNPNLDDVMREIWTLQVMKKYKRVTCVSYKANAETLKAFLGEENVMSYGSASGSNGFVDGGIPTDCLIVLGTYQPPPDAIYDSLLCLYDTMKIPETRVTQKGRILPLFSPKQVRYNIWDEEGQQASRFVGGFWGNEDMQRVAEWHTGRTIVQAVGRSRYNTRSDVDVYLMSPHSTGLMIDNIYEHLPIAPKSIAPKKWAMIFKGIGRMRVGDNPLILTNQMVADFIIECGGKSSERYVANEKWLSEIAEHMGGKMSKVSGKGRPKLVAIV
ncbi:hypothetical protein N9137_02090 [Pseudomonadales bacterium]|nr:hypothetical protein [Pseudomonadales bacterium]